jgi:hypothetical protein
MRKRLVQVLERDDEDEPMDAVVRRFWSRTTPPSPTTTKYANGVLRVNAKVVVREHAKSVVREHANGVVREHANGVVREHANLVPREHANVIDLASARRARARGEPSPL